MDFALLLCPAPTSTDWEIPLRDPESCFLAGWVAERESYEGGAPWAVRHLLSRTLCRLGTVTYLSQSGEAVPHSKHKAVTTRDPKKVAALFDDPAYPWSQHGQAALISAEGAPALTSKLLNEVVGQRRVEAAERAGYKGLLLPGVDGAVAGIWMFQPDGLLEFRAALEEPGAEIHTVTEDQFRSSLSY